jgi:hypothetical protein
MVARIRPVRETQRAQLSPAQMVMMEILESAQVAVVAIFCIGIVCIATYAIAFGLIGIFIGPETGKLLGLALSTVAGIAGLYTIATNRSIRNYLSRLGKHDGNAKR